jgi:hypothetical protein
MAGPPSLHPLVTAGEIVGVKPDVATVKVCFHT